MLTSSICLIQNRVLMEANARFEVQQAVIKSQSITPCWRCVISSLPLPGRKVYKPGALARALR